MTRISIAELEHNQFARTLKSNTEQALRFAETSSPNAAPGVFTGTQGIAFTKRLILRDALIQNFNEGSRFVNVMSSLSMADIGAAASQQAGEVVAQRGALLFAAVAEAASRKVGMANRHSVIAREAQSAVIAAYERRFTNNVGSYRQGDPKRLSGQMLKALRDPSLMIAQRDGILMFNEAVLDEKAAHWYRLNFGAQPRGRQKISKTYKLDFEGATVGEISLKHRRPSGRFSMPAGVFISPGGEIVGHDVNRRGWDKFYTIGAFYRNIGGKGAVLDVSKLGARPKETKAGRRGLALNTPKDIPTQGIVGGLFFDAGVKVVAKQLPILYSTLLDEWSEEASSVGTGPVAKVLARPL